MRRSALHYILFGAALGLGVPLVFRLASTALESYAGARDVMWTVFDNVQLMLWPTPLLLVPIEEPGAPDLSSWVHSRLQLWRTSRYTPCSRVLFGWAWRSPV